MAADLAVEPTRMNWPKGMNITNEQSAAANWMITKMAAGVTMLHADTRGRLQINGLAGLDVKVLTHTTTRDAVFWSDGMNEYISAQIT